jgi:hypothetical protein
MDTNAWFRDSLRIGGGLVTFAVAIAAIGTLATQGEQHRSHLWFEVAAVVALVGVVLVVVGWSGEHLTHKHPVTEAHAEVLRTSANFLLVSVVGRGGECDYGSGHKPREAFQAHYPAIAPILDEWDALLKADILARGALKERVWDAAKDVANATEGRWSLDSAHIAVHVTDSTQNRAKNDELDADFSLSEPYPPWAIPLRDDGESAADWEARIERSIARVEAFGRTSQDWPEAKAAAESYRHLEDFKASKRPPLVEALKLAEEDSATFEKRCPTCRGTQ